MMKLKSLFLLSGLLIFLFPAICLGAQINVGSVSDFVTGGDMDGLQVIAEYLYGPPVNAVWTQGTGSEDGVATGFIPDSQTKAYELKQSSDTYSNNWKLFNYYYENPVMSLTLIGSGIEGLYPNIVFDLLPYDIPAGSPDDYEPGFEVSTPGSKRGIIELDGSTSYSMIDRVLYQGQPTNDLWSGIQIGFGDEGLPLSAMPQYIPAFSFYLDTDRVTAVPIPAAYLLFGSGLLCLIGIKRKTR